LSAKNLSKFATLTDKTKWAFLYPVVTSTLRNFSPLLFRRPGALAYTNVNVLLVLLTSLHDLMGTVIVRD